MVTLRTNVSDPVGDLLTRVRNANIAYKEELVVPVSKMNEALLGILEREGYIGGFGREGEGIHSSFRVRLKYDRSRKRTISGLKRVSTPGRRVYAKRDRLPRVLGGLGIAILSTSQGLMTDREASRKGVGGEVLAHVW
ncbi:MAG TPA: 30S ribosomal protein S8 [Actinomycetota bacterium]|uniref:Small ribosomal subunit protein uS8 n=1 Tax=uncultured actinobacterium Rifle_16ft_4_minimus_12599 TaxID=1665144 RepID=A0A0H4T3L2_9ACTN|nr:30S ribosomal protein S8, small subunit ribosomal protein S8 [uncultured actinobacterium Rifle_16ft_4_minimus_12599]HLB62129.1 30S ribosomal protein S8 [Actinomycetota bacterium]